MRRPNGQGSIYYEKSKKRYAASFITPEGRRIVKRFPTTEEAENWLEDNRYSIRHNTFVTPSGIRTGAWILQYIDTYKKNVRPRTLSLYFAILEKIEPIADIPLQKLTGMDVQALINSLDGKISTSYIKKIYELLNMAIKKAVALDILAKNPIGTVERPKVTQKKIQIFTIDEIHQILAYAKERHRDRLYMEILVATYTGLRIGELLALTWNDITPAFIHITKTLGQDGHGVIYVQNATKTSHSRRDVSIPLSLYETLKEWQESTRAHGGLVFKAKNGNFLFPSNERIAFQGVQKDLGIFPIRSFHALRHTHASQLLANGVPIAEVSKRLGHASPAITLTTYTSWIPGNDEKVANDVERIFR